ncbi:MAG: substrate-binding domain-containing protein [Planctomycetia bacterium]|nr:substrate-binding domain-containing protein [Planctomycetia bacterium]
MAVVVGCNGASTSAPSGGPKKLRIAVIPKGTTHEFWKSVHYGAARAAKELDVELSWDGPLLENDTESQIRIVESCITKRVDGICLAPNDSKALIDVVEQAKAKKIPTVIFDSGLEAPQSIVSYVATDNEHGGVLGAQTLAKSMGEQGNVVILRYNVGSESTHLREEGFLKELAKFPKITVLSSSEYSGATPESSLAKCQALLLNFGDKVNGMYAVAEPNGVGMLGALEEKHLDGKVKFVGFDTSPRLVDAMKVGKMQGIVLQDPDTMGYLAVKTLVAHLRGEKVEPRIATGEYVATPENMNSPEMKRLLDPPTYAD